MASPKKGVAYILDIPLFDTASLGDLKVNPTIAEGDFKVSTGNGAFANLDTLPVVEPTGSVNVKIAISQNEMDDARVRVKGVDVAGDEWEDVFISLDVETDEDSVFEHLLEDHTTPGTYGAEIATKADLSASASTDYVQAIAGSVINGTETSGTYASTRSRNGVYWQVTEDNVDGLIVELTFNLPSSDHRPGVVNVHGRYTGNPPNQHYMDLYIYNVELAEWEELLDRFLPGGNTNDANYTHEFYERHIDRGNNNEVKIRIIHNPTSYNASHNLYLDYVDVSSIKVVTAKEIAAAVWDLIPGTPVTGSMGEFMVRLWDEAGGRRVLDSVTFQEIFYRADNITEIMRFNLFDKDGNPSVTNVYERVRV